MSLDERTFDWLKRRKEFPKRDFNRHYFCAYCDHFKSDRLCVSALCPITAAHVVPRDAAEFEARVAAKLSIREDRLTPCILDQNPETHGECKQWRFYWRNSYAVYWGCAACRLKYARLAVEAEMEQEGK